MIKYYFALLVLSLPILSYAQIQHAEDYNAGDELHYMVCTMPDSPGSAGTSIIWNFHAVQDSGNGQRTTWVLDDTASPGDIILSQNPIPTGGNKVHKTATKSLLTYSLATPVTYTYDEGVLIIDRTLTYGLLDSNAYTSSISVAANTLTGGGTSKIEVDGSGTLKTPMGTFNNVLRVKRTIDNIDSIPGTSLRNLQVGYIWYDGLHTAPLFRIDSLYRTGTGFLAPNSIVAATAQYLQDIFPVAIKNVAQSNSTIAAHLSDEGLLLNAGLNKGKEYSINLFNTAGQKLYGSTFNATGSMQLFKLNTNLPQGVYLMVISGSANTDTPMVTRLVKE